VTIACRRVAQDGKRAMFSYRLAVFVGKIAPVSYRLVPFSYRLAEIFVRGKIRAARRSGTVILAMSLLPKPLLKIHIQGQL
jgi:hypothetical protein